MAGNSVSRKEKKILLTAVNAKYIHSNPAVYYLKSYAEERNPELAEHIRIAEFTINQEEDDILRQIYLEKPDILAFSCYIWNITRVEALIVELAKLLPDTVIWLGGPEVSFDGVKRLTRLPQVTGIMNGEGEAVFYDLAEYYVNGAGSLAEIAGIVYRESGCMPVRMNDEAAGSENKTGRGEELHRNPSRDYLDLNDVPFPYKDLSGMEHRIVYYETSRGCPFACSYCLSSVDRKVRLRDMSLVEKELQFFLDHHVPQVKFVDRTFNCNPAHTRAIWEYIREHDNGVTNFHFEIAAELLREEELELLASFRPGLVQLEIGIQTVNPDTLTAICRKADMVKLSAIVRRLLLAGNMHIHLDLIAGLPYEDLASFRNSFKAVYDLHPEQLQLGFLKVLKGSPMERQSAEYGIIYKEQPPYEVLSTRWLSYGDILELKQVEEMLETYYNSGQFLLTMRYLEHFYENPYDLYRELALFYEKEGLFDRKLNRYDRYESLRRFWLESRCAGVSDREDGSFCAGTDNAGEDNASRRQNGDESEIIDTLLLHDLYARENVKSRPAYGRSGEVPKEEYREFFESGRYEKWLPDYAGMKPAQVSRMVHLEKVEIDPFQTAKAGKRVEWKGYLLYDYQSIHAIIRNARCVPIAEQMKQMNETPDGRKR